MVGSIHEDELRLMPEPSGEACQAALQRGAILPEAMQAQNAQPRPLERLWQGPLLAQFAESISCLQIHLLPKPRR